MAITDSYDGEVVYPQVPSGITSLELFKYIKPFLAKFLEDKACDVRVDTQLHIVDWLMTRMEEIANSDDPDDKYDRERLQKLLDFISEGSKKHIAEAYNELVTLMAKNQFSLKEELRKFKERLDSYEPRLNPVPEVVQKVPNPFLEVMYLDQESAEVLYAMGKKLEVPDDVVNPRSAILAASCVFEYRKTPEELKALEKYTTALEKIFKDQEATV